MSNAASEPTNAEHAVAHVNWCTCLLGIIANPPGPSTAVVPESFISTFADPLTIMTCSVGVCQCHGNIHPAVPLNTITDGPLVGSPLSTANVAHGGSPAIGANLLSDILRMTPIS